MAVAVPEPVRAHGQPDPGGSTTGSLEPGRERPATRPPEARGLGRDQVRLMVASRAGIEHVRFWELQRVLRAGDLLVVNTSATLPAAVDGERGSGQRVAVHFSTELENGDRAVEVRPAGRATGPVDDAEAGERILLPDRAVLTLLAPYPPGATGSARPRLWRAKLVGAEAWALFRRHGRPVAYAYVEGRWPLESYQTVFAREPGSAEMPSAGRPFTDRLVTALVALGVGFAPVVLHTGVSSAEAGEPPLPERFRVADTTASRVNATREAGGRIIAVGTTAARALESASSVVGSVAAAAGWTELVLGPDRPPRVLDGLLTGWHSPGASHLRLLEAVAGPRVVERAYEEALFDGYLWHEFGDSCLLLAEGS